MNKLKFNSQICTTKEQSQRLLDLGLKSETADMVYHNTNSRIEIMRWELNPLPPTLKSTTHLNIDKLNVFKHKNSDGKVMSGEEYFNTIWGKDIPAWSLHRLIGMLPSEIKQIDCYYSLTFKKDIIQYEDYDIDVLNSFGDSTNFYDNVVDCIEWLIKEDYINKEYLKR